MSGSTTSSRDMLYKVVGITLVLSVASIVGLRFFSSSNKKAQIVGEDDEPPNAYNKVLDVSDPEDTTQSEEVNYIEEDFITKDGVIHMKSPHRDGNGNDGNDSDTDTVATECDDDKDFGTDRLVYDGSASNALGSSSTKTVMTDSGYDDELTPEARFKRAWKNKRGDTLMVIEDWYVQVADSTTVDKDDFEDNSSLAGNTTITDPTNSVTYTISVYKDAPKQPTGMSLMQCLKTYKELKELRKKFIAQATSKNSTLLLQALASLESRVPFPGKVSYMFYPTPALITAQQARLNEYFEALCLDDTLMQSIGELQQLLRA